MNETFIENSLTQCAAGNTCKNCTIIEGCTWCGETLGCWSNSYPPCIIGTNTCETLQECMRKEPQFHGYGSAAIPLIIFSILVCVSTIVVLWVLGILLIDYRRRRIQRRQMIESGMQLRSYIDSIENPRPDSVFNRNSDGLEFLSPGHSINPGLNVNRLNTEVPRFKRFGDCFGVFILLLCFCLSISVLLMVVLFVELSPKLPNYYICNRELDWMSIFSSFATSGKYGLLVTIENPNRFPIRLSNGYLRVLYKDIEIGEYQMHENILFPQGSLVDIYDKVNFYPTLYYAHEIYTEWEDNTLFLDFAIKGDATVQLLNWDVFTFPVNIVLANEPFGKDVETSREMCKCKADYEEKNENHVQNITKNEIINN